MRQLIEKSAFDWSRGENKKILARGVAAMSVLSHKIDATGNLVLSGSSRCVWDNIRSKSDTRYLKRRVWIS